MIHPHFWRLSYSWVNVCFHFLVFKGCITVIWSQFLNLLLLLILGLYPLYALYPHYWWLFIRNLVALHPCSVVEHQHQSVLVENVVRFDFCQFNVSRLIVFLQYSLKILSFLTERLIRSSLYNLLTYGRLIKKIYLYMLIFTVPLFNTLKTVHHQNHLFLF